MTMTIGYTHLLCLLLMHLDAANTQNTFTSGRKPSQPSFCDSVKQTSLVEHFFNVIFSELQSSPPVCVCVQMCLNQPTYCYPNGCLKKIDNKKPNAEETRPAPVANVQNIDAASTMFLIDEKNDFAHMFNENNDGGRNVLPDKASVKEMRPDPFKDRYKMLFKFKKMPKVELKYNLREQVKNMKSDILRVETKDISKKRWPNANIKLLSERQRVKANEISDKQMADTGNTKFLQNKNDPSAYTSKYFKRDLRKLKGDQDGDGDYPAENPDLDNQVFTIEALIDNLIGNNYEGKRDAENDLYIQTNISDDVPLNNTVLNATVTDLNYNVSKTNDEMTCIVSINKTNQNLDENKYTDDNAKVKDSLDKWKNYTFNEMIAYLSKNIEKQNNTSMIMMEQISRNNIKIPTAEKVKKPLKTDDNLKTVENSNTTEHKKLINEKYPNITEHNKLKDEKHPNTTENKKFMEEKQTVVITTNTYKQNATQEDKRKQSES